LLNRYALYSDTAGFAFVQQRRGYYRLKGGRTEKPEQRVKFPSQAQ
jgi:hypothetical protein